MPDGAFAATGAPPRSPFRHGVSGRAWFWRVEGDGVAARLGAGIAEAAGVPELVGRLLAARGVAPDGVDDFLRPTLRSLLPDPSILLGMDRLALRLADAVRRRETVGVFGDYDVDGACAAAMLAGTLQRLGCRVHVHVPDRIREGYGPNAPALHALAAAGATLLCCVDCGTAAGAVLEPVAAAGPDILVLDHHLAAATPRGVLATVNPNVPPDRSGLGHLCAAAVVFLALVALLRLLRRDASVDAAALPDLLDETDLVALATICDVVPLRGVNRALVATGLKVMARRARPGLAALLAVAGGHRAPDAFTCGFALGPRINAGGRIGDASMGLRLLLTSDADEAAELAGALDAVNRDRRVLEGAILARAIDAGGEQLARGHATIVLEGADWHPGVVGVVAARLRERFNRPACVGAASSGALTKGSGRSAAGLDLGGAITDARLHGVLETGGGHAMAAGYGHRAGAAAALHAFLDERLGAARALPAREPLHCDGALLPRAATAALAASVATLAPFGRDNEEPLFVLLRARVRHAERVGAEGRTVRAMVEGEDGGRVKAMLFGAADDDPVATLALTPGAPPLDLVGHLRPDGWNGQESVCFAMRDAAVS